MNQNELIPEDYSFIRELNLITRYAQLAIDAIQDESEGNFKYYVNDVYERVNELHKNVSRM